jgi:hypothetical protein
VILPIYLPPGASAPDDAIDLAVSCDPQRHRRVASVVLRRLDVEQIVAAALLAMRRAGFTEAGAGWRARRNYEAYFDDDGDVTVRLAERLRCSADSSTVREVCVPAPSRALALEDRVYVAACWLLWGDPRAGEPWGVDGMAREIAAECGGDILPRCVR